MLPLCCSSEPDAGRAGSEMARIMGVNAQSKHYFHPADGCAGSEMARIREGGRQCWVAVPCREPADGRAGSEMARIMGVNIIGVFLTLLVTAQIAISVRNLVRTQLEETTPPKQSFPFNRAHYVGWGEVLVHALAHGQHTQDVGCECHFDTAWCECHF